MYQEEVMRMSIELRYDERVTEVFKRAQEICKRNGLKEIDVFFLFIEIMREPDCSFYDYLKEIRDCSSEEIEQSLEKCMDKVIKAAKKALKSEENETERICTLGTEKYRVTREVADIFALIGENIEQVQIAIEEQLAKMNPSIELEEQYIAADINYIMGYIIENMPPTVTSFIRMLGLKANRIQEGYLNLVEGGQDEIPEMLGTFLKEVTVPEGQELILGRDKEVRQVWNIISKKNKKYAILVGKTGVGKTAIIEKLAQDIQNGECPEKFRDYKIMSLDINCMIAKVMYQQQAEGVFDLFNMLKEFLDQTQKVILFVDEIHTMFGMGYASENEIQLASLLKPILIDEKRIVVGAIPHFEYMIFSRDEILKRRFEKVIVEEPKTKDVYHMLKNQIAGLEEYHGVRVSKQIAEFCILAATCTNLYTPNPARTIDLLDKAMGVAENMGKPFLTKACIMKACDFKVEEFEKTSEDIKRETAYHEAGHFVVTTKSEYLKDHKTIAISILPAFSWGGVNIYEGTDEAISGTRQYYIDEIASCLAGREAERMIFKEDNTGVLQDLEYATRMAYQIITRCAMVDEHNIAYLFDEEVQLINEKSIDQVRKAVQKLLKEGEQRARLILEENRTLLDAVAQELLKKKLVSEKDLEKIVQRVENSKQK